jgi:nucleotide-binding universal stress UspA family protein
MKHIILPTDFSRNAMNASKYALKLFKNERCTFHLVHCYAPLESHHSIYATALDWDAPDNVNRMNSEQGLEQFSSKLKENGRQPWHFFKTVSSPALLSGEIKQLIRETRAEMIIMGTKGATGLKEIFMGSTTVHIIKSIKNCPVLAIPEKLQF